MKPWFQILLFLISIVSANAQKTSGFSKDVVNYSAIRTMNTSFGPLTESQHASIQIHRGLLPLIINRYEIDSDGDGVVDAYDECHSTTNGVTVDYKGCEIFALDSETFVIETLSNSCIGTNEGVIKVELLDESYDYVVKLSPESGQSLELNDTNNFKGEFRGLPTGNYDLCLTIPGVDNYEQCFEVNITEPAPLQVVTSADYSNKMVDLILSGDGPYIIEINEREFITEKKRLSIQLEPGNNKIAVRTKLICQGSYFEEIFVSEEVIVYPNPTEGQVQIYVGGKDNTVELSVLNLQGQSLFNNQIQVGNNRVIEYDLGNYPSGVYLLQLTGKEVNQRIKVVKL